MTKQRAIIYEIIQATAEHLTAEDIFLRAKQRFPTISIATVYRNLGLMVRAGEIRRVSISGADRFDRNVCEHDHLICVECGSMSDVTVDGLKADLEQLTGEHILSHDLNMYYLCPECRGRSSEEPGEGA